MALSPLEPYPFCFTPSLAPWLCMILLARLHAQDSGCYNNTLDVRSATATRDGRGTTVSLQGGSGNSGLQCNAAWAGASQPQPFWVPSIVGPPHGVGGTRDMLRDLLVAKKALGTGCRSACVNSRASESAEARCVYAALGVSLLASPTTHSTLSLWHTVS